MKVTVFQLKFISINRESDLASRPSLSTSDLKPLTQEIKREKGGWK